jgi:hypothetical protein
MIFPGRSSSIYYPSTKSFAELLELESTSIKIYPFAGKQIGRKFSDNGQLGTIMNDYISLCKMGPFKDILRPREPRGVATISPSPQSGAKNKKSLPSYLA